MSLTILTPPLSDGEHVMLYNALAHVGVTDPHISHNPEYFRQYKTTEYPRDILLVLGDVMWRKITGFTGGVNSISKWRGFYIHPQEDLNFPHDFYFKWVFTSYDMEWHRKNNFTATSWLYRDIARAVQAHSTPPLEIPTKENIAYVTGDPVAIDIETKGLSMDLDLVGLASRTYRVVHPASQDMRTAKILLENNSLKIIQNAAFDIPVLAENGLPVRGPLWDTMYAMQMIDPDSPGFSLDEIASWTLPLRRWKHLGSPSTAPKKPKIKHWKRPFYCAACNKSSLSGTGVKDKRICSRCASEDYRNDLAEWEKALRTYNLRDTVYLIDIQRRQEEILRSRGQLPLFEQQMKVMRRVLLPMQMTGLKIDTTKQNELRESYEESARRELLGWNIATENTNPRSYKQLCDLFYENWDLPPQFAKDKNYKLRLSVGAEALNNFIQDKSIDPEIRATLKTLTNYKRHTKWATTYLNSADRIFPRYGPAKKDDSGSKRFAGLAATGRIIAKGDRTTKTPPIQQFPDPLKQIVVPDNGFFIAADYDSQELRIIAYLSGDKNLISQIEAREDIHARNAELFGVDRTRAKNLFYGMAFAGRGRALQSALRQHGYVVSLAEIDSFLEKARSAYPQLFAWHNQCVSEAQSRGYITNPFGRRRYFPYNAHKRRSEIINFPVQSTGADILWHAILSVQNSVAKLGGKIALLQFDSVMLDLAEEKISDGIDLLTRHLCQPFPQVAPNFYCPITVKIGTNWGEMETA